MQQHRLSPEQHLMRKEMEEVNRIAWSLRKVTGGALRLAMQLKVPEHLREDVWERVQFIQKKHKVRDDS
jgi:hypothetical protein